MNQEIGTSAFLKDQLNKCIDFMLIKKSDETSDLVRVLYIQFEMNEKANYKENLRKYFDEKDYLLSKNEIENIPSSIKDNKRKDKRKDRINSDLNDLAEKLEENNKKEVRFEGIFNSQIDLN